MTLHLRPFRNGDPPELAALWDRGLPASGVARPMTAYGFDALVADRLDFDPAGLIVAERDGRAVGFAHAGFGPVDPDGPPRRLDTGMGTVAMLVVDPAEAVAGTEVERRLVAAAERYLRDRGAQVIYAGGRYPLNPFYWGRYGGSEFAGILSSHTGFHRAVMAMGYEPTGTVVLLEAELAAPEPRDPRGVLLRRQVRVEVEDDAILPGWWDSLALGSFHPAGFRLVSKSDGREVARAFSWEMRGFDAPDGLRRRGLIGLEVESSHRRRGYGRLIVGEVFKHAREQQADVVSVQTVGTNAPALGLYGGFGFHRVETSTLYRLRHDPDGRRPGDEPAA